MSVHDVLYILKGALVTLEIAAIALVGGSCVGFLVGFAHTSRSGILNVAAHIYSEVLRSIPILIVLFVTYFGLPILFRVEISSLLAITVGFILWTGAYMSEIVKAGIQSVHRDQWDAARSLRMNYIQQMYYVVLPQAFRVIIPPAAGFFVGLIKDTSVVYILGYPELLRAGRTIIQRTRLSIPIFLGIAGIYFAICFPLSRFARKLENRLARTLERKG